MPPQYKISKMFRDNSVLSTDMCFRVLLIGSVFMTKKQELSSGTPFNNFYILIKVVDYLFIYLFIYPFKIL